MPRINFFGIPADDPERAQRFYSNVFGWCFQVGWEYDTPTGREKYWDVVTGDESESGINGGLTRREFPGQAISVGVEVTGIDAILQRLEAEGGKVIVGKMQIPGRAWFAFCQDPEGNSFAIFEPLVRG